MNVAAEWLESDGLGGFAFGRADGLRTRRYHALLNVAMTPPTGRLTLVNGLDAWVQSGGQRFAISSQRYTPDVVHPDGARHLLSFTTQPWPTWRYRLPNGVELVQELLVTHGSPLTVLAWHLTKPGDARLIVRPFLGMRDAHGETHENPAFDFTATVSGERIAWRPYAELPTVVALTNGAYTADPAWYRNFQYDEERARGLGFVEDLASPGALEFALGRARAVLAFGTDGHGASPLLNGDAYTCYETATRVERERRASFATPLHRAADAYVVRRGTGRTIVAGYPWFSDWGRDTFIALRGICIAGDRLDDARDILLEWAKYVSEGMLPNYFPEGDRAAEYNSVDASLWYVVAVHDYLRAAEARGLVADDHVRTLGAAVTAIVAGYARGTRFGIRADAQGLLAAGIPGVQLTWMDAKIGDWVVTPRIGKPVEVQALWINAMRIAARWEPRWTALARTAEAAFIERFWNQFGGCLFDVVDVDHRSGAVDASVRPNQILAVGGLPIPIVTGEKARRIVDVVAAKLWTPAGLRSLESRHPSYAPRYAGDMCARDSVYHQGTVWPWLAGPFIEAWVRVRGSTTEARKLARSAYLQPLLAHYEASAPGHLGEIADGNTPHTPNGCPFQAWSVGEALRLANDVLRVPSRNGAAHARRARAALAGSR
jgi:predicted glycogen debranching enzyme